jgi:hypothetical protein
VSEIHESSLLLKDGNKNMKRRCRDQRPRGARGIGGEEENI